MNAKWYAINTIVGYETKVAAQITEEVKRSGIEVLIEDIVAPAEINVEHNKSTAKKAMAKGIIPGYCFAKMELSDDLINIISNCRYVLRFLSDGKKPIPIPEKQMCELLEKIKQRSSSQYIGSKLYVIGDVVKIIDGSFTSFSAVVEYVDEVKQKLKLKVSIFGRATSLELSFQHVEKAENSSYMQLKSAVCRLSVFFIDL